MDNKDVLISDLEKVFYFNEFFINISEGFIKNLEFFDLNILIFYVIRVIFIRCDIELNWELVKKKIEKLLNLSKVIGLD